jgi:hypothetical protein
LVISGWFRVAVPAARAGRQWRPSRPRAVRSAPRSCDSTPQGGQWSRSCASAERGRRRSTPVTDPTLA